MDICYREFSKISDETYFLKLLWNNIYFIEKMSRKLYNNRDKTRRVVLWQMEFMLK